MGRRCLAWAGQLWSGGNTQPALAEHYNQYIKPFGYPLFSFPTITLTDIG